MLCFHDDTPRIQIANITGANAHISKVGIRVWNSMAQFQPIKIGTVSAYQFRSNNLSAVSGKTLDYKYNLTLISLNRYVWIPEFIFNREYEYRTLAGIDPAHIGKAIIMDDGNLLKDATRDATKKEMRQLETFYNSTFPFLSNGGYFNLRANY